MNIKTLEKAGLSEREVKVYTSLIKLGMSKPGDIQKESKVPSSKIGETLNKLKKKDIIEILMINKKKRYKAKDPTILLERYDNERKEVEKSINELKLIKKIKQEEFVELYQGFKAIRELFKSLLHDAKQGEEYFGFSSGETADIKEIWDLYTFIGRLREEKGVKNLQLITKKEKLQKKFKKTYTKVIKEHAKKGYKYKEMVRYSSIHFPGDVAIFRDDVVILNLTAEKPSAMFMSGKHISENYKKFFMDAWKKAK